MADRLISANWIYDKVENRYRASSGIEHRCERDFLDLICEAPTVDAVPVVRCKNCVSFEETHRTVCEVTGEVYCGGYCYYWDYEQGMSPNQVDGNDFCSNGERRCEE